MKLCKDCKTFEYYMHHDMEPCKYCEHFHVEWIPGVNHSELGASCFAKVSCEQIALESAELEVQKHE